MFLKKIDPFKRVFKSLIPYDLNAKMIFVKIVQTHFR